MTQCEALLNFVSGHEKDPIFAKDGATIRQLKAQKNDTLIEKAVYIYKINNSSEWLKNQQIHTSISAECWR